MSTRRAEVNWAVEWIETYDQLEVLGRAIVEKKVLSVDTETADWQTGNERLCLVQIGIPDEKRVVLVDVLAVKDLQPLEAALSATSPLVIAHNAQFEERQFSRHGIKLRGIADTLPMARKLRPDLPNFTLQTCCRYLLQVELDKQEQVSDWSVRPLSQDQIHYAALDAQIAYELYSVLAQLEERLKVSPELVVSQLMEELAKNTHQKIQLTKEIAAELAYLSAREELLKDAIRSRLIAGEPSYDGEFGFCKVSRVKRTEINPVKVRENFPTIADKVVSEYVERARLLAVLKEEGIDAAALEKVLDITGYTDRLSLSITDLGSKVKTIPHLKVVND